MAPQVVAPAVKAAYLDHADPAQVAHAVRDVLERRGALVSEHLHSRVRFRGLTPARHTWSREGYVGIYQRLGEREVEVRLLLRARWPWRLLWTVALANVLAVVAILATRPSGTMVFLATFLMAFALLVAGIVYLQTWRPVRREERELMDEMEAEFQRDISGVRVVDDEARALAEAEAELAGEIERRRLARERREHPLPKAKGARFSLRPGRKPEPAADAPAPPAAAEAGSVLSEYSDEQLEDRRRDLLRRKAELEARRREMERRERS